ncbi:MAG: DUF1353 domain-containing protein [Actinomycetota bacterium]
MTFEPEFVVLTEYGHERPHDWILTERLEYTPPSGGPTTIVEEGFDTDLASVPLLLSWYAPRYGLYTKAAIVHDHLCKDRKGDRFQGDLVFRKRMEELGVPLVKRWVMWTDLAVNPRATWRGWILWVSPLLKAVTVLLATPLRKVLPPVPGPSRRELAAKFKAGNSREQRLGNLLLAE